MKKSFIFSVIASFFVLSFFQSCDEDDDLTIDDVLLVRDTIKENYRTINYTVMVESASNATGKVQGTEGATVAVAIDGQTISATTDASGFANFTGLKAGTAAVVVSMSEYTTANMVVELRISSDSIYDSEAERYAATSVVLFPTAGEGAATIMGTATYRYTDDTSFTGNRLRGAPDGTKIIATFNIPSDADALLGGYVRHMGDGAVLDIVYEWTSVSTTVSNGNFSIEVPSASQGLPITLTPNPFKADYINIPGNTLPDQVWTSSPQNFSLISGQMRYYDFQWF